MCILIRFVPKSIGNLPTPRETCEGPVKIPSVVLEKIQEHENMKNKMATMAAIMISIKCKKVKFL